MIAIRDAFVVTPASTRAAVLRSIRALDLRAQLPALSVPTTVVVGGRDRLTPPRLGRTIARAVPGARLVEVADGGHMLPLEAPDLLADLIGAATGIPGDTPASPGAPATRPEETR
jgi:pimeloyl-ACP methyl ester carboxylesterase